MEKSVLFHFGNTREGAEPTADCLGNVSLFFGNTYEFYLVMKFLNNENGN